MEAIFQSALDDERTLGVTTEVLDDGCGPGELFPSMRELTTDFQVTRTRLEFALLRLHRLGLIGLKGSKGDSSRENAIIGGPELLTLLVRTGAPGWLDSIFTARREIGALIATQAAKHAKPSDRALLLRILKEVASAGSTDDVQLADCEIHRVLADATGNRVYQHLSNVLLDTYLSVRQQLCGPFKSPAEAAARLEPMIVAVCNGRSGAALNAARVYMDQTQQLMLGRNP